MCRKVYTVFISKLNRPPCFGVKMKWRANLKATSKLHKDSNRFLHSIITFILLSIIEKFCDDDDDDDMCSIYKFVLVCCGYYIVIHRYQCFSLLFFFLFFLLCRYTSIDFKVKIFFANAITLRHHVSFIMGYSLPQPHRVWIR